MTDKPPMVELTAEELLDAMAETWADRTGIVGQLKSLPSNLPTEEMRQRFDDLVLRWVKNSYREGLYEGRLSIRVPSQTELVGKLREALEDAIDHADKNGMQNWPCFVKMRKAIGLIDGVGKSQ